MSEQSTFQFVIDVLNSAQKNELDPTDTMVELVGIIVAMEFNSARMTGNDISTMQAATNRALSEMREVHKIHEAMANN